MDNASYLQFLGFLSTPPLWENTLFELPQFKFPAVTVSQNFKPDDHEPRLNSMFVLGKRAEHFFELAMELSGAYSVLARGIQIFRDGTTIGEIDFLLEEKFTGKIFHVEQVYKFYVYDPAFELEQDRWIGPNRRDTLIKKISRLREKQLPLLHQKETIQQLQNLDISTVSAHQQVCFLASLFLPKKIISAEKLPYINTDCIAGFWIHAEEFTETEYSDAQFFTPKKPDWSVDPAHHTIWVSYEYILEQINLFLAEKRSPLVWLKRREGTFERFFIVWW